MDLNFTSLDDADYEMFLKSEGLRNREHAAASAGAAPAPARRRTDFPFWALLFLAILTAAATILNLDWVRGEPDAAADQGR